MAFNPSKCLKFKALEDNCEISIDPSVIDGSHYQFSKDGISWVDDTIVLNKDETCYVKGIIYPRGAQFTITALVEIVSGNVMSLVDDGAGEERKASYYSGFQNLFQGCSNLKAICSNFLPATLLSDFSYSQMFEGCTSLEVIPSGLFPVIENTKFPLGCYLDMFKGCASLKEIHVSFHSWEPNEGSFSNWVADVAPNGTFYCPEDLPKEYGTTRIPSGWEVKPEVPPAPPTKPKAASATFLNQYKIGGRRI